jgi:hypothetical protein
VESEELIHVEWIDTRGIDCFQEECGVAFRGCCGVRYLLFVSGPGNEGRSLSQLSQDHLPHRSDVTDQTV